jgi:NADPH2:quinone reductase
MKAAVLHTFGEAPRFEDFPDPTPSSDEILLQVKAVALENVDKAMAQGTHFGGAQFLPALPAIVAFDGIGALEDGRLVGFGGIRPPYGAMAEKVVIPRGYYAAIPEGIDAVTAAAVPGSALTALFPLKWGAKLQPHETVLVNGATGFTGKLAVQVAKLLGAGRVVGTGRDVAALQTLLKLGADAVVDLKQSEASIADALIQAGGASGYQVILDFLWGRPTELILETFIPRQLSFAKQRTRLIQIGEMAGSSLRLPAAALRTSGLEIMGAGGGLTPEAIAEGTQQVWAWIQAGVLGFAIEVMPLKDVESAWQRSNTLHGKRIVIVP